MRKRKRRKWRRKKNKRSRKKTRRRRKKKGQGETESESMQGTRRNHRKYFRKQSMVHNAKRGGHLEWLMSLGKGCPWGQGKQAGRGGLRDE